jgi:hypothetical protein
MGRRASTAATDRERLLPEECPLSPGAGVFKLQAMARTTANVIRDGGESEIPLAGIAAGDVVVLDAGSPVPADLRLIATKGFSTSQSALTGEPRGAAPGPPWRWDNELVTRKVCRDVERGPRAMMRLEFDC